MVVVYCTSSQNTLSLKEVSTKSLQQFKSYCHEPKNLIKGNNSKRKQGRVKALVYCTASQCLLSFHEVSTRSLEKI